MCVFMCTYVKYTSSNNLFKQTLHTASCTTSKLLLLKAFKLRVSAIRKCLGCVEAGGRTFAALSRKIVSMPTTVDLMIA